MTNAEPLLRLEGVTKTYGEGAGATEVLRGVDLELRAGEHTCVLGPSGCGKSTLLNVSGALEPPTSGSVTFKGADLTRMSQADLAKFRRESLGFVFQHHHLLPQLTALENVLVPALAEPGGSVDAAFRERAESLLERVGLADRRTHRPAALSGGERQRVAVVRALVTEPSLILADEPTGSLDAAAAQGLGELLREEAEREGAALFVVTHSADLAETMSRRILLDAGRVASGAL